MGFFKNHIFFSVGLILVLKKIGGKLSNSWCAMKVLVDFGSVDLKKMSEMQMQENTYFVGFKVGFFLLEMDFSGSS